MPASNLAQVLMNSRLQIAACVFAGFLAAAYAGSYLMSKSTTDQSSAETRTPIIATKNSPTPPTEPANLETITLGSGCFWCTETMFQNLRGVKSAVSGYSGGKTPNPTYEQV